MAKNSNTIQKLKKNRTTVMNTVKDVHDKVLVIADELVDLTVDTGSKYQKITEKAIKKSQPIMDKQMEIIMDSIEEMKAQYTKGNKRFLKLLGIEKQTKKLSRNINKTYQSTKKQIVETVQDIEEKITGNAVTDIKNMKTSASKTAKTIAKKVKGINIEKLSSLNGIGPKLEKILKEAGINNMNDLIKTDVKTIKNVLAKAGPRYSAYNPVEWIKEARKAMK